MVKKQSVSLPRYKEIDVLAGGATECLVQRLFYFCSWSFALALPPSLRSQHRLPPAGRQCSRDFLFLSRQYDQRRQTEKRLRPSGEAGTRV